MLFINGVLFVELIEYKFYVTITGLLHKVLYIFIICYILRHYYGEDSDIFIHR